MYTQAELGLEDVSFYKAQVRALEQVADCAQRAGDARAQARAMLDLGRVKEKMRDFPEATKLAEEALAQYQAAGDASGVALYYHTIGVWAFHHGADDRSLRSFQTAVAIRERLGELLLAAQSWHNLGYVQCRTDRADAAFRSYRASKRLLDRLRARRSKELAGKADRGLGFVLSHLAFASAKHRSRSAALAATVEYFAHVGRTKVHREPLLAYIAPPIALATAKGMHGGGAASRLKELTGLQIEPETWFRFALGEGRRALLAHEAGSGRRPYLGARLLTLAEYGSWCVRNGRYAEGTALRSEALSLACERGWDGESRRFEHAAG